MKIFEQHKTLPKALRDLLADPRVSDISDEREYANGFVVFLIPAYYSPETDSGTINADTADECLAIFANIKLWPQDHEQMDQVRRDEIADWIKKNPEQAKAADLL